MCFILIFLFFFLFAIPQVPQAITIGSLLFGLNLALTLFFNISQDFQLNQSPLGQVSAAK